MKGEKEKVNDRKMKQRNERNIVTGRYSCCCCFFFSRIPKSSSIQKKIKIHTILLCHDRYTLSISGRLITITKKKRKKKKTMSREKTK